MIHLLNRFAYIHQHPVSSPRTDNSSLVFSLLAMCAAMLPLRWRLDKATGKQDVPHVPH